MVYSATDQLEEIFVFKFRQLDETNYKNSRYPTEADILCLHFTLDLSVKYLYSWFKRRLRRFVNEKREESAKRAEAQKKKLAAREIDPESFTELIIPLRKIPDHLLHQKHTSSVHLSNDELTMLRAAFEINSTPSASEIEKMIIENFPGRNFRFIKNWFYRERHARKMKKKNKYKG